MSRAFAPGESEDDGERLIVKVAVLPPGTPNYMTPAGKKMLEEERTRLIAEKTALPDTVESKQRGKGIDQHLTYVTERLNGAHVIDPASQNKDIVLFGAKVTVRSQGPAPETQTWRIVGVDEVDLEKGWISWISPLAKALMDKRIGETATLGSRTFTVLKIEY